MNLDEITAYPLAWPVSRPRVAASQRKRARFNSGGSPVTVWVGIERARRELERMGAERVIISSNLPTRRDGLPMSKVREPVDPGVAVYFRLRQAPHVMACDTWDRVADNLAAISLHAEAVRGQLRWGVADLAQAFAGFRALPAATAVKPWWQILGFGQPPETRATVEDRWRDLARRHHPDVGGSANAMAEINAARDEGLRAVTR